MSDAESLENSAFINRALFTNTWPFPTPRPYKRPPKSYFIFNMVNKKFPLMAFTLLHFFIACSLSMHLSMARQNPVDIPATELHEPAMANPPSSTREAMGVEHLAAPPMQSSNDERHPFDKSEAGGEVIIGGLAAAVFVTTFFYIRVTRKRRGENKS